MNLDKLNLLIQKDIENTILSVERKNINISKIKNNIINFSTLFLLKLKDENIKFYIFNIKKMLISIEENHHISKLGDAFFFMQHSSNGVSERLFNDEFIAPFLKKLSALYEFKNSDISHHVLKEIKYLILEYNDHHKDNQIDIEDFFYSLSNFKNENSPPNFRYNLLLDYHLYNEYDLIFNIKETILNVYQNNINKMFFDNYDLNVDIPFSFLNKDIISQLKSLIKKDEFIENNSTLNFKNKGNIDKYLKDFTFKINENKVNFDISNFKFLVNNFIKALSENFHHTKEHDFLSTSRVQNNCFYIFKLNKILDMIIYENKNIFIKNKIFLNNNKDRFLNYYLNIQNEYLNNILNKIVKNNQHCYMFNNEDISNLLMIMKNTSPSYYIDHLNFIVINKEKIEMVDGSNFKFLINYFKNNTEFKIDFEKRNLDQLCFELYFLPSLNCHKLKDKKLKESVVDYILSMKFKLNDHEFIENKRKKMISYILNSLQ